MRVIVSSSRASMGFASLLLPLLVFAAGAQAQVGFRMGIK